MNAISLRLSEPALEALAERLAKRCVAGDCLLLYGDLGAGKTTFARRFIQSLAGGQQEVLSPTFSLVQRYDTSLGCSLSHFDLYRLKQAQELLEIGFEDVLGQDIVLIEWPQIAGDMLPDDALTIEIAYTDNAQQREVRLTGRGVSWQERLRTMGENA
jgi:tRNA threonylcarbamoyl adenosine modification protein YjeE